MSEANLLEPVPLSAPLIHFQPCIVCSNRKAVAAKSKDPKASTGRIRWSRAEEAISGLAWHLLGVTFQPASWFFLMQKKGSLVERNGIPDQNYKSPSQTNRWHSGCGKVTFLGPPQICMIWVMGPYRRYQKLVTMKTTIFLESFFCFCLTSFCFFFPKWWKGISNC